MVIEQQKLNDVLLLRPNVFNDERGYFFESFKQKIFEENGLELNFIQDNQVLSKNAGTLRGLHYQLNNPQGKLIHVVAGSIRDVIVDIRVGSPNFGESIMIHLDDKKHEMVYVPEGFAHGYLVLEKNTIVHYKCTNYYDQASEFGVFWKDKDLNIDWNIKEPILSKKDSNLPMLKNQKNLPILS